MSRALYPGTFDPITNGHVDLIHRASRLFATQSVTKPEMEAATAQRQTVNAGQNLAPIEVQLLGSDLRIANISSLLDDHIPSLPC